MYRSFYGLTLKPFQISSDPKFLWLGEKHQEALAILKYGILDNRGFLLLTGDVGTGKTTLINALVNSLGPDTIVAHVPDPGLTAMDFLDFIADAFRMDAKFNTKGGFLIAFRNFLEKAHANRKQVLLIIDEAQRLDAALLEEIRLLSNIELQQTKLINIFFVGQDELIEILSRTENRALRQRMTLNYHIDPLTEEETDAFVRHRLKVAGTEKRIFSPTAIREIHAFSSGYPRLVNIICDHALLTGYVKGMNQIDGEIIAECAKELRLSKRPSHEQKPDISHPMSPLPNRVVLPHPAAPPAPSPQRSRGGLLFSVLGLFLLGFGAFIALDNGELAGSLRRGISLLSFYVTDEAKQPADKPQEPAKKQAPEPVKPEPAPEPAVSRMSVPSPPETTVSEDKATPPVISGPIPPQSAPAPATKMTLPILPEENVTPAPQISSHLFLRFNNNSNELLPDAYDLLNQLAAYLKKTPAATIGIFGYTDNMGSQGYNMSLSGFRANIVKNYLLGNGISASRMTVTGLGAVDPVAGNDTPEGRNANRRVEIKVRKP